VSLLGILLDNKDKTGYPNMIKSMTIEMYCATNYFLIARL